MDELQEIARLLFSDKRSETLGWQVLFEGMTGLRTNEILSLRLDSRPDEPGGITEDGRSMCVRRSKKPGRDNPYVLIHEGLKPFIAAHRQWHQKRYPQSPCYFPGRNVGEDQPVYKCALTRALDRLFKEKKLKRKFTSHVMEARQRVAQEAETQLRQQTESFVADCITTLRAQTAQLCDEMLNSINTSETGVHQKTLNRLINFIDQFKKLNFAGDREMETQLNEVRQQLLSRTAEQYRNNDNWKQQLVQGLTGLATKAKEMASEDKTVMVHTFGELGKRKFSLAA